jgi:four helix bundle protein
VSSIQGRFEDMSGKDKKPHRNLVAWQKGMDLVMEVYKLTQNFPERELYGLSSQLRRAALSVPSNIAEGAADRTHAQFSHFLSTALGSLNEIDTQLELSFRLGYLSEYEYSKISALLDECLAVTYGLRKCITSKLKR